MLDLIEHPFISFMTILAIVSGVLFGITILGYYGTGSNKADNFHYIDIDGNEGFAQWCNHEKNLNCYRDGGYVQVKEFHKK